MSRLNPTKKTNTPIPVYQPSEMQIAIAFVDYVNKKHPNLAEDLIKIDNENKCSAIEGMLKKKMGKRKGASDYFFSRPKTKKLPENLGSNDTEVVYFGLWLEIKAKKGKESAEQKAFGIRRLEQGYQYKCVFGLDEAIKEFEDYIEGNSR